MEITLKQLEDEHRIKERALKTDIRALHVSLKEQELSQENYTFALKAETLPITEGSSMRQLAWTYMSGCNSVCSTS